MVAFLLLPHPAHSRNWLRQSGELWQGIRRALTSPARRLQEDLARAGIRSDQFPEHELERLALILNSPDLSMARLLQPPINDPSQIRSAELTVALIGLRMLDQSGRMDTTAINRFMQDVYGIPSFSHSNSDIWETVAAIDSAERIGNLFQNILLGQQSLFARGLSSRSQWDILSDWLQILDFAELGFSRELRGRMRDDLFAGFGKVADRRAGDLVIDFIGDPTEDILYESWFNQGLLRFLGRGQQGAGFFEPGEMRYWLQLELVHFTRNRRAALVISLQRNTSLTMMARWMEALYQSPHMALDDVARFFNHTQDRMWEVNRELPENFERIRAELWDYAHRYPGLRRVMIRASEIYGESL